MLGTQNRGGRMMGRNWGSGGSVKVARYREILPTNRLVSRRLLIIVK